MLAGITFDLRDYYISSGFSEEEAAEFDSAATIGAIDNSLKELGFDTDRIGNVSQLVDRLAKGDRWDFIFNIAEGLYGIGREAQIPALCDAYKIPYTFSDPCILSLTLNKELTKRVVRDIGLKTPDFMLIYTPEQTDELNLEFPLFAKPYAEGTSKGIDARSVINDTDTLREVCDGLLKKYKQPVLVETYLPGREFTVGILGTGNDARAIGVMEVLLNENAEPGVYSYNNKENCEEFVVYRLAGDGTALKSAGLALNAWKGLGCHDSGRVDVRCDSNGIPNFIEVNPLAGLHPEHSDLPIICGKAGIKYIDLIASILNSCFKRYGMLDKAHGKVRNVYVSGIDTGEIKSNEKNQNSKKSGRKAQVILLHQAVPENAAEDEKDVLVQASEISDSLDRLGYDSARFPVTLDLESLKSYLLQNPERIIFNLVESIASSDRLANTIPALLDFLKMEYTGSNSRAIALTGDKISAKLIMGRAGIPTPAFFLLHYTGVKDIPEGRYIIKSIYDHASAGMTGDSVINVKADGGRALAGKIKTISQKYRAGCFMEQYIDGREFNVSVLAGEKKPEILPIAEIIFKNFPEGKARIVDYNAKWNTDSEEYKNTVRSFKKGKEDKNIHEKLSEIAFKCWRLFGLNGYARVDFRVDEEGNPWVLETNANPCLSSDAGLMAAAAEAGIDRHEVIRRILNNRG